MAQQEQNSKLKQQGRMSFNSFRLMLYIIGLSFGIISCSNMISSKKVHHIVLPKNYAGSVFIEFNKANAKPLEVNDTAMFIKVSNSGVLQTSTSYTDFVEFRSLQKIVWENSEYNNKYEIRNYLYGYFSDGSNDKYDTVIEDGKKVFKSHKTAADFNYLCFIVNPDPHKIKWDFLIAELIRAGKTCDNIVDEKSGMNE